MQLFRTKGQKFLHCSGRKGQRDRLKILPRDGTDKCCSSTIISVLKQHNRLCKSIVLFFSFITNLLDLTGLIFIGSFKETIMAKCQTQGGTIFTTQKKSMYKSTKSIGTNCAGSYVYFTSSVNLWHLRPESKL